MKKISPCQNCDNCCKHIAIEIDKPTSKQDQSHIVWYLMHKNIRVFVGHDRKWYLRFLSRCKGLTKNKRCGIYAERPIICREYSAESCVQDGDGVDEKISFSSREEFLEYLEKNKRKRK